MLRFVAVALQLLLLVVATTEAVSTGPFYYDQLVDHFSPTNTATFKQKFYAQEAAQTGPVFLYISGEAPLGGLPSDAVTQIYAKQFQASIVSLEARVKRVWTP